MSIVWKDVTSYRQGEAARIPRSFHGEAGDLRITVTRYVGYPENSWLMRCEPFITLREISTGSAEEAQRMAVEILMTKINMTQSVIRDYLFPS